MKKQYAVIGNPVLHSLSPLIHQRAFDFYQIEARYFAYEVEDFSAFMQYFHAGNQTGNTVSHARDVSRAHDVPLFQEGGFIPYSYLGCQGGLYQKNLKLVPYAGQDFSFPLQGLSVTIPHKKAVLQAADRIGYKARLAGAANTLYWDKGELVAENTDIAGFFAPLEAYFHNNPPFHSALVYGAGGAACAVLTALLHMRELQTVYLCARREEQAQELISHFKAHGDLMREYGLNTKAELRFIPLRHEEFACDLAVNTIPQWGAEAVSPRADFTGVRFAYDLTYKQTPFLEKAQEYGVFCQDGKTMFIEQAKAQFKFWTGLEIPIRCYQDIF